MKKTLFTLAIIAIVQLSYAQWTTSGSDIYNSNAGNVGIGASNFLQKFTIKSPGTQTGGSSTDYDFGITDGAAFQLQLLGLVNTTGNYGLLQVIKGGVGPGNLALQTQGGNVGIGTTSPSAKLDVAGGLLLSSATTSEPAYGMRVISGLGTSLVSSYQMEFKTGSTPTQRMFISESGNISIGTTDPQGYKLAINGSAIATSMTVKLYANWPDYVFKKSYKLSTLAAIKNYIDKNHHLPDMPTEQQVAKNGINLGEIVKLQTKKIEELTLYLIEKDKQLNRQQVENKQQNQRIAALESALSKLTNNK